MPHNTSLVDLVRTVQQGSLTPELRQRLVHTWQQLLPADQHLTRRIWLAAARLDPELWQPVFAVLPAEDPPA